MITFVGALLSLSLLLHRILNLERGRVTLGIPPAALGVCVRVCDVAMVCTSAAVVALMVRGWSLGSQEPFYYY